jgi:glycosyltransferase involved in cell wall biosynthesis
MSQYYFLIPNFDTTNVLVIRLLTIVSGLVDLGRGVTVLTFEEKYDTKSNVGKILGKVKVVHLHKCTLFSNYCFDLAINLSVLLRKLKRGDWLYVYSIPSYESFIILLVKIIKKVKITGEMSEYPDVVVPNSIKGQLQLFIYRYLGLRIIDKLFVISEALKRYCLDLGIDKGKLFISSIIVNEDRFQNTSKASNRERYIAYCGTISNQKDGVDDLIKSFLIVHKKHQDYKLYLIGETPLLHDKNINDTLIADNHIDDYVIFTGKLSYDQIPQVLTNAEILVLARPDNRQAKGGMPSKVGEYLYSGNPVVLTRVGELASFLTDKQNCIFAEPGNIDDIAQKIMFLIDNPHYAAIVGANGRKLASDRFSKKAQSGLLLEFLEN